MTNDQFFEKFATLRNLLTNISALNRPLILTSGYELVQLAATAQEEALAHAILVRVGAETADVSAKTRGIQVLHSLPTELLSDALEAISDMAYIGSHDQRWNLVKTLCTFNDDPGMLFIEEPSFGGAEDLVDSQWTPGHDLPAWLQRELRLQVGWKALELALQTANIRASNLVESKTLRSRDEAGWWELDTQLAVNALIRGRLSEGVRRLELLLKKNPPEWSLQRIRFEIVRFAPLAVDMSANWLRCCPGGLPVSKEAPSTALAAATAVASVLEHPESGKPGMLGRLSSEFAEAPWMTLGLFLEPNLKDALRFGLAKMLLDLDGRKFAALPWEGREELFAAACSRCDDREVAISLLLRADSLRPTGPYATAMADVINKGGIDLLQSLDLVQIGRFFEHHHALCPESLRGVIARGGISRAVVDGSNVMWGGRERAKGVQPKFAHFEDAYNQLRDAGYSDIRVFVDAKTKFELSEQDRHKLRDWVNDYRISHIERHADPHIIKYFLKDPDHSEIVTSDHYRDWIRQPEYQALEDWWPQRRRTFHVDQDQRVVFHVPLTRRIS